MSTKKIVLVDMDGVLVALTDAWLDAYAKAGGEIILPDQITTYNFTDHVKDPELFYSVLESAHVFLVAEGYGRVGRLRALCEAYDVHIVTYVHSTAPSGHADKLTWLAQHFPWFDLNRVIFAKHKYLVQGDCIIEDSPENIDAWLEANKKGMAICIRQPYNRDWRPKHSTRVLMADDLDEAESILRRTWL